MKKLVSILYIDDNPMDRALVRDSLEKEHGGFELTEAKSQSEFEKMIHLEDYDLVLTDFNIMGYEGLQVIDYINTHFPEIPVIIVTGTGSEEVAVEAMKRGAADYVIKTTSHISRLPKTIHAVLDAKRIRDERKTALADLQKINRIYAVISQVNQMIVRTHTRDEIFRKACEIAIEFGKFRMAWIGLIEGETKTIKPFCWSGFEDGYLTSIRIEQSDAMPEGKGPGGISIRTGKYSVCNDVENDPSIEPWRKEALKRDYRSGIALPIKQANKSIALFCIYSSEANFFDQKEIELLEEVTEDISFALDSINSNIERNISEEALKVSHIKYKTLFELIPLGVTISDKNGKIVESNKEAERLLGLSSDEHAKRNIDGPEWRIIRPDGTLMPPDEFASVRALKEKRTIYNVEMGIDKGLGDITWINVAASPIPLENFGVIIMYFDISDRKLAEENLKQLKKNLEVEVEKKTKELQIRVEELQHFQDVTIDRELRMEELRNEIKRLKGEI